MAKLEFAARTGPLKISNIVVAEVSPSFGSLDAFQHAIGVLSIISEPLSNEAAFLAGLAFRLYREQRRVEQSKSLLADFFIGAHAITMGATLLTRDPRFYCRYFPDLTLITPETHP